MSDDDDWFERALRELEEGSDEDDETGGDDADRERVADSDGDDEGYVDGDGSGGDDRTDGEWTDDGPVPEVSPDEPDEGTGSDGDADPFGGYRRRDEAVDETGREGETDDDGDGNDETDDDGDGNDDPLGGGGGTFGQGDPFGGGGDGGGGSFGQGDPFGGGDGGGGSFGEGDPFGGGSFGEGDPFGSGGETTDGPTGFDEDTAEEFDSDIDRTDIGIEGLDEMILGGVPSQSLLAVIGGPGTGKTTFSLQFLNEALASDERGVYITLEQSRESILATADEKGWSFQEHAEEGRLAVVSLDPIEMANSLASIRNDLTRLIADFGADRLVLDSVSLLEMMYDHPAKRRSEVFGFTRLLKEAGVTTLLTSEASDETPYASRYGLVEYLTDGVFVLQYVRGSDFQETRLAVEIQKIRNANHSRETKPYEITNEGMSVYRQANIF